MEVIGYTLAQQHETSSRAATALKDARKGRMTTLAELQALRQDQRDADNALAETVALIKQHEVLVLHNMPQVQIFTGMLVEEFEQRGALQIIEIAATHVKTINAMMDKLQLMGLIFDGFNGNRSRMRFPQQEGEGEQHDDDPDHQEEEEEEEEEEDEDDDDPDHQEEEEEEEEDEDEDEDEE